MNNTPIMNPHNDKNNNNNNNKKNPSSKKSTFSFQEEDNNSNNNNNAFFNANESVPENFNSQFFSSSPSSFSSSSSSPKSNHSFNNLEIEIEDWDDNNNNNEESLQDDSLLEDDEIIINRPNLQLAEELRRFQLERLANLNNEDEPPFLSSSSSNSSTSASLIDQNNNQINERQNSNNNNNRIKFLFKNKQAELRNGYFENNKREFKQFVASLNPLHPFVNFISREQLKQRNLYKSTTDFICSPIFDPSTSQANKEQLVEIAFPNSMGAENNFQVPPFIPPPSFPYQDINLLRIEFLLHKQQRHLLPLNYYSANSSLGAELDNLDLRVQDDSGEDGSFDENFTFLDFQRKNLLKKIQFILRKKPKLRSKAEDIFLESRKIILFGLNFQDNASSVLTGLYSSKNIDELKCPKGHANIFCSCKQPSICGVNIATHRKAGTISHIRGEILFPSEETRDTVFQKLKAWFKSPAAKFKWNLKKGKPYHQRKSLKHSSQNSSSQNSNNNSQNSKKKNQSNRFAILENFADDEEKNFDFWQTHQLKICFANVQSWNAKKIEFLEAIHLLEGDIIGIAKTWLNPRATAPKIKGFEWIGLNRKANSVFGDSHGGVALLINSKAPLSFKRIPTEDFFGEFDEALFVEVKYTNNLGLTVPSKFFVGVFYLPAGSTVYTHANGRNKLRRFFENLKTFILHLQEQAPVILLGDFNAHIGKNDQVSLFMDAADEDEPDHEIDSLDDENENQSYEQDKVIAEPEETDQSLLVVPSPDNSPPLSSFIDEDEAEMTCNSTVGIFGEDQVDFAGSLLINCATACNLFFMNGRRSPTDLFTCFPAAAIAGGSVVDYILMDSSIAKAFTPLVVETNLDFGSDH
jgi:hypothetical protein